MVIFKSVSCKNFFSVGNQPIVIQLNKAPTTLVAGPNGSGKSSTILDSIYFALFGKAFRNVNKPNIVNSINGGHLVVELEFSVGQKEYKLIRGMKPTIFEIYENGKLIDQDSLNNDYQKYLEDTILGGLNEKVFKQVVVIGSADYQPFMQLPAAHRREVIEELLDIKIFSQMLDIAKSKMVVLKDELKDLDYQVELTDEKIKLYTNNASRRNDEIKEKQQDLRKKIEEELDRINKAQDQNLQLEEKRKSFDQKLIGLPLLQKTITDLQSLASQLKNTFGSTQKQFETLSNNDQCPTCLQDICKDHKTKLIDEANSKKTELTVAIAKIEKSIVEKKENLKKYDKLQKSLAEINQLIYQCQADIKTSQKLIKSWEDESTSLTTKNQDVTKELTDLQTLRDQLTEQRNKKLEERQYYEVVSGLLKDGGIKTKIIKQYIPVMNKIINDYLIRFGLPIEFTLDEQFNEVIKSRYRDNFQYNNFSEGEKQRIDTALLLAWRQLAKAKNTTNTNLLIMDETFDSSLDEVATDELLSILLEMDNKTNIFIISHKQHLYDKLRSFIEFEKHGNFTRVKPKTEIS